MKAPLDINNLANLIGALPSHTLMSHNNFTNIFATKLFLTPYSVSKLASVSLHFFIYFFEDIEYNIRKFHEK